MNAEAVLALVRVLIDDFSVLTCAVSNYWTVFAAERVVLSVVPDAFAELADFTA